MSGVQENCLLPFHRKGSDATVTLAPRESKQIQFWHRINLHLIASLSLGVDRPVDACRPSISSKFSLDNMASTTTMMKSAAHVQVQLWPASRSGQMVPSLTLCRSKVLFDFGANKSLLAGTEAPPVWEASHLCTCWSSQCSSSDPCSR